MPLVLTMTTNNQQVTILFSLML
ncbi:hypothetical protein H4I96_03233 [Botrytis cinerea]